MEETFLKKEQEDEYSLRLCKEFRYLQRKFEIGQGMDATLWRFLRLRPENFPHIRLAQLAYLYQKGDKLFSRLLEAETLADVRTLLDARTSSLLGKSLFIRTTFFTKGEGDGRAFQGFDNH